jgi:hypothetical protein
MSVGRTITRLTLAPTARTLPSGVPLARGINLSAPGVSDGHGHGVEGRTDYAGVPKWATRTDLASNGSGLISRTRLNCAFCFRSLFFSRGFEHLELEGDPIQVRRAVDAGQESA